MLSAFLLYRNTHIVKEEHDTRQTSMSVTLFSMIAPPAFILYVYSVGLEWTKQRTR